MKKLTFFISLICMFLALHAQDKNIIGKIENNIPKLTANTDLLCKALSKNLALASNIKEDFTSAELLKYNTYYLLVFRGSKYKTTFRAKAENLILMVDPKTSCTTTDTNCSNSPGCAPSSNVGECLCTKCPGTATCTKTCSSESLLEL